MEDATPSKMNAVKNAFVSKTGDPIKGLGCFMAFCGTCPCIIYVTFLGIYASLFSLASTFDAFYENGLEINSLYTTDFTYDNCGIIPLLEECQAEAGYDFIPSFFIEYSGNHVLNPEDLLTIGKLINELNNYDCSPEELSTNWSVIYTINVIVYAILTGCLFLMCCTCFVWPIGWLGLIGHSFGFCAHLAAVVVTGVFRYNSYGEACASFKQEWAIDDNNTDAISFEEHGSMIQGLFISICVLWCCTNCVVICIMQVVPSLTKLKRSGI